MPRQGLFRGNRLLAYFERHFGQRTFADLDLPLALVAVDLNTGQEIILREGPVALAVRATVALPGLLAPVEVDGRRLADGGLLNNLPADVARQIDAEVVIAVDVSPKRGEIWLNHIRWAPKGVAGTLQVLSESVGIMMSAIDEQKLRHATPEVLIRPAIPAGVSAVAGYNRTDELISAGERAAEATLPCIRAQMHPRWHWPARGRTRRTWFRSPPRPGFPGAANTRCRRAERVRSPAGRRSPGMRASPVLGSARVKVRSGLTTSPGVSPVVASSPAGTSSASTRLADVLHTVMPRPW